MRKCFSSTFSVLLNSKIKSHMGPFGALCTLLYHVMYVKKTVQGQELVALEHSRKSEHCKKAAGE